MLGKPVSNELLDDGDAGVRIFDRLDSVANAHDVEVLLLHVLDELDRAEAGVEGGGELFGRVVQRSSESWTLDGIKKGELDFN